MCLIVSKQDIGLGFGYEGRVWAEWTTYLWHRGEGGVKCSDTGETGMVMSSHLK